MTFVRYFTIQLLAYGIDMGLFLVFFKLGLTGPIEANVLSKLTSGIFSFVAHRNFTFRAEERASIGHQASRYFLLLLLNIPIASIILAFLLAWISEPVTAKFIADIVLVATNFVLSKRIVFAGKQGVK